MGFRVPPGEGDAEEIPIAGLHHRPGVCQRQRRSAVATSPDKGSFRRLPGQALEEERQPFREVGRILRVVLWPLETQLLPATPVLHDVTRVDPDRIPLPSSRRSQPVDVYRPGPAATREMDSIGIYLRRRGG